MAGSAFYDYGGDLIPVPLVDHPHQRFHQHHTLLDSLLGRKSHPEAHPNYPDIDMRSTAQEYLIEVEVPGIKDASELSVEWTSSRSLVVCGISERPQWEQNALKDENRLPSGPVTSKTGTRDEHGEWKAPEGGSEQLLLIGERRIGPFRRHFSFPVDVDAETLSAKLESGLLRLRVPKMERHVPKGNIVVKVED